MKSFIISTSFLLLRSSSLHHKNSFSDQFRSEETRTQRRRSDELGGKSERLSLLGRKLTDAHPAVLDDHPVIVDDHPAVVLLLLIEPNQAASPQPLEQVCGGKRVRVSHLILMRDAAHHILTSDINQQFRVQKYFRTTEMFSQIFSTSISRHSFSFLTLLYTAVVLNLAVFLIVVPLTGIAMEQSLRFHTYKIYFNPRY